MQEVRKLETRSSLFCTKGWEAERCSFGNSIALRDEVRVSECCQSRRDMLLGGRASDEHDSARVRRLDEFLHDHCKRGLSVGNSLCAFVLRSEALVERHERVIYSAPFAFLLRGLSSFAIESNFAPRQIDKNQFSADCFVRFG